MRKLRQVQEMIVFKGRFDLDRNPLIINNLKVLFM
jgi:hypothetical protein